MPGPDEAMSARVLLVIAANEQGEIWLLVGTDSGFEGKTTLYYEGIGATLRPEG